MLLAKQNEKISRQKDEIIQISREIQDVTASKISFFTNITHELRTPLTLIVGPIQRALRISSNPQVMEQLHLVERNAKYLLSLINQLMDFQKVESNKLQITLKRSNLTALFEAVLLPFKAYAKDKGVEFRYCHRLPGGDMLTDEEAIHKVIVNLIGNALKYTPPGGNITIYVAAVRQAAQDRLYIAVKDTGIGIPPDDIDKVFERFFQSGNHSNASISGQSGTGIGLYLCKQIVSLLNGTIEMKNNRKAGCTFRILLPLQYAATAAPEPDEAPKEPLPPTLPAGTKQAVILVVEDNKEMRDYIHSILSEHYRVVEASLGEEALMMLQSQHIDFILSDLMMPVMDGIELSRRVKADFSISHIPFLMLTAKTSDETRIESYRMGVDDFLSKPFDEELLLVRISNILESRKNLQKRFSYGMDVELLHIEESSKDKKFLDRVMQVVKENYKNPDYDIDDFVAAMGISRSLLYKKIQVLTGQSAGYFIRNYRLNAAYELIQQNRKTHNMNISDIAYSVGFNDPKYFTRCFTKFFHATPSKLMSAE
jgi:CheY-like chemotaxis protein/AraC-like DNA-binding protein/nitrogen-specific signal transduction histidine kinase